MIIGFWKRLLSDFIDALFLGLVGFLLSLVTGDMFYEVGSKGAWIGLIISFLYTGLLQTSLSEGQSLGKKILGIQVLSMDGSYLSFPKSFLRYGVLVFFLYNGAIGQMLGLATNMNWVSYLFFTLVVVAFLGCFLMVPIHPLKRGLHDLIAGSVVVKKGTFTKTLVKMDKEKVKRAKVAYGVWGTACLLVFVAGFFFWSRVSQMPGMDKLFQVRDQVEQGTAFDQVSVNLNTSSFNNSRPTTALIIGGYLPKKYFDGQAADQEASKAALLAAKIMAGTKPFDGIRVRTMKGYNIGIWSFNYSSNHDFKVDGSPVDKK